MLHLRLHNDKIWIEQDWTEKGIATELQEAGVPNFVTVQSINSE